MFPALLALLGGAGAAGAAGIGAGAASAAPALGAGAGAALGGSALPGFMAGGAIPQMAAGEGIGAGSFLKGGPMPNYDGLGGTGGKQMDALMGANPGISTDYSGQGYGIPGANISAQGKAALDEMSSNSKAKEYSLFDRLTGKSGLKGITKEEFAGMSEEERARIEKYLMSEQTAENSIQRDLGMSGGGMEAKDMGGALGLGNIMGMSRAGGPAAGSAMPQPGQGMQNPYLAKLLGM